MGYRLRILAAFAIVAVAPAHALIQRCLQTNVLVEAATAGEAGSACTGAAAAVRFLASEGLDVSARVRLRIVRKLPAGNPKSSAGCYIHAERCAYVLRFTEYSKLEVEGRVSAADYLGVIAHEVAHAFAEHNFRHRPPAMLGQEYVACVAQYATMDPEQREMSLAKFPGTGFDAPIQMSLTAYLVSPGWFCAQAYRHYLKPGNGSTFLKNVLTGMYFEE